MYDIHRDYEPMVSSLEYLYTMRELQCTGR